MGNSENKRGMTRLHERARWKIVFSIAVVAIAANPQAVEAHPHILIQARSEVLFNPQGQLVGVTNIWDFDDAFSAYAIQGYDSKGDGKPTREDLQPFAEINLKSLAEYKYFTSLKVGGVPVVFAKPKDYFDIFADEKLTLHFTLPLSNPVDMHDKSAELDVYDSEYFAAISYAESKPVTLVGAKAGCDSAIHRPEPLDPAIASQLAVIPADQRSLPPELFAITDKLVNASIVTCR